jgi:peroxiredoxin
MLAKPLVAILPLTELSIGVTLLTRFSRPGAMTALTLLLIFSIGIGVNLWVGRRPACGCFGRWSAGPLRATALVRNGSLMVLALVVILVDRAQLSDASSIVGQLVRWFDTSDGPAALLGLLVAGALLAGVWGFLSLLRQNRRLLLRIERLELQAGYQHPYRFRASTEAPPTGMSIGVVAPSFAAQSLDGRTVTLDDLRRPGSPILLVFMDPDCGPCQALASSVGDYQNVGSMMNRIVMISKGKLAAAREMANKYRLTDVLIGGKPDVFHEYGIQGTPAAIQINPDGVTTSYLLEGVDPMTSAGALSWMWSGSRGPVPRPQWLWTASAGLPHSYPARRPWSMTRRCGACTTKSFFVTWDSSRSTRSPQRWLGHRLRDARTADGSRRASTSRTGWWPFSTARA